MPDEGSGGEHPSPVDSPFDLDLLQREVGQHFPFYDMRLGGNAVVFFCRIDEELLEEKFDALRLALLEKGYIPMLRFEQGEHLIYVIKKPVAKKKPIWINIVLLVATIFSTTVAGAYQWVGIDATRAGITNADFLTMIVQSLQPNYLAEGFLFFSIPLMLILGIHEMGHYYASRKHRVDASLPYFIPLPPPFILGTFGAVISTREPIPNRKALLDIGAAGPICGFLVAIPITLLGFFLMQQSPVIAQNTADKVSFINPLLLQWMQGLFAIPENAVMHPTLFAGWVGIFLTAVNLLPVGQLDGGHVARAILKEKHKYASWGVLIILIILGLFYLGWFFLAFIILFLIGTQHQPPLNEYTHLDTKRKLIALAILLIFIISFAPLP